MIDPAVAERCESLLDHLPPFPPVALRLMRELSAPESDIEAVVNLLRSDPAMTAQLVAQANSALHGRGAEVRSVRQSVVKLGFQETHRIAMRAATASYAGKAFKTPELQRCWRHSLATAELASELAGVVGGDADQAYTAALMHDIGRLGLLVGHTDEYIELVHELEQDAIPDSTLVLDREKDYFGVDHCEAGCWLLEHWNAPLEMGAAAGMHHHPPPANVVGLGEIVHYACRLATSLGFGTIDTTWMGFEAVIEEIPDVLSDNIAEDEGLRDRIAEKIDSLSTDPGSKHAPPAKERADQNGSGKKGLMGKLTRVWG